MNTHRLLTMTRHARRWAVATGTMMVLLSSMVATAQVPPPPASRTPQPLPDPSEYTRTESPDGMTTFLSTPTGKFPESDPFINPTNLLPTVYENVKAADGTPIPNTLPSTPENPYNLHPDPVVEPINPTSPTDDLGAIIKGWRRDMIGHRDDHHEYDDDIDDEDRGKKGRHGRHKKHKQHRPQYDPTKFDASVLQRAIDILEGNPVPDRVYSGIPVLHYNGPNKVKKVQPIKDDEGNVIGGNVEVHQVWFDTHIESDTAFLDPSEVADVEWTITYVVDTLNRGHDDFSPMQMYLDDPKIFGKGVPLVLMDKTFFPMEEGTRTIYEIKMAPGRFYNLTYTWGWRMHPPRVAVMENANKMAMGNTLPGIEIDIFGEDPRANQAAKEAAIGMIGDLSPAKRMWLGFRRLQRTGFNPLVMREVERAFFQWGNRTELPDGVDQDPEADVTLFFVNNTIYGQMKGYDNTNAQAELTKWKTRGTTVKIKLINGDYFPHGYVAVDFGGLRGWENTFQNTIPVQGAGPWFTFGRAWWQINNGPNGPVIVPAAESGGRPYQGQGWRSRVRNHAKSKKYQKYKKYWQDELDPEGKEMHKLFRRPTMPAYGSADILGEHNVELTLNYEPSRRLRIYQFDPLHHEQAIWSMH